MIYLKYFLYLGFIASFSHCTVPEKNTVKISSDKRNWAIEFSTAINKHLHQSVTKDTLFVHFNDGVYPFNESFGFFGDSSVNTNAPIVIKGNDKTVFTGGITLDNRALRPVSNIDVRNRIISIEARDKILEYDLHNNGITDLGELQSIGFGRSREASTAQLYINGERMTLARYPNAGDPHLLKMRKEVIPINKIISPGKEAVVLPVGGTDTTSERGVFEYEDKRVEMWLNASDIWLDGIFSRDWAWSFNKIGKIDTINKTIELKYEERYDLTDERSYFFATNLLEEIDVPGEYFIDREKGMLYVYPPTDFNLNNSQIQLSGNTQAFLEFERIENLTIENIHFEMGRFNAIGISQCSFINIINCTFSNFGHSAIIADGNNITVEQCKIYSIGGTAIELNGGDFATLEASNNTVVNCDISDWGNYHRVYSSAVALNGVGCKVIANNLHFSPHGAINLSGNNHLISRNEMSNVFLEFEDFGAIYAFLGRNQLMRGTIISHNYFHNLGLIGERVNVIYPDEATADWTIESNLFYKIGGKGSRVSAIGTNTSSHLSINNNLFLDCSQTLELGFHFSTWGKARYTYFRRFWEKQFSDMDSIPTVYSEMYPELKNFINEERIYVNTNSFTNNIIGNFSIPLRHDGLFITLSDLENADSLVITKGNRFTKDKSLIEFLEKWNSTKNREELKTEMPELLRKYLIE